MATACEDAVREMELAQVALTSSHVDAAVEHLSVAIRGFTAEGDHCQAAMACVRLGDLYANAMGNSTAARAWFLRASRLVEDEPPCIEQGWVAVAALGCEVDDPSLLLARAELALQRGRQFGDVNLETKAMADAGLAHVQAGRVVEGMTLLDEAMALACGPADDTAAASKSVCSFLTACYYAADFDRAGTWADTLRRRGLIGSSPGGTVMLSNHCDSVHATALCELGRWQEAEAMLTQAIAEFEAGMHMPSWHPVIALAELRIRQGRLVEAEMLLLGKDGHFQALLPAARLHLARGDHDLARATATRGLRAIGDDRLRAAELLAVLVDTELGVGNIEGAIAACEDLVVRAGPLEVPSLRARIAAARARVAAASGDIASAIGTMETALDHLPAAGVPLLRVSLLVDLVRLHDRAGNRAAARVEAARAASALAGLDIVLPSDDVALLDRVGAPGPASADRVAQRPATLRREDRCWLVACSDMQARLPDTKGLRYLAELLRSPGVERHALDLVDRVEGVASAESGLDRRQLGDAGELVDAQARSAYRRRIEALRAEIDEAFERHDEDEAEKRQAELDQLVGQLAEAFGLGGRSRRSSSATEKARLNVTRALRSATAKVSEALPEAGSVLDRRLRTGLYCAYEPDDADDVRWSFIPG